MARLTLSVLVTLAARLTAGLGITVDSFNVGNEGAKAIDGNTSTFWHTQYSPTVKPLPHTAILDVGSLQLLNGFSYLPRQDGTSNGNIGQYKLEASTDNTTFTIVGSGTFEDDSSPKYVGFANRNARYLRLTAITEAGNRGSWSSAAELKVLLAPTGDTSKGVWGPMIAFPLVPAAGFVTPLTGKVVTFASYRTNTFVGSGNTYTATYDIASGNVSEKNVQNTKHDMFCPGISIDVNGRAIVTGGDDANKTSIYVPATDSWISGSNMKIARGYQSTATLSDGRIFTDGGSWSGGRGGKNGEIYQPTTDTWTLLPGCPVAPMLTADAQGIFRQDNHAWFFGWKNGSVFQAGPSKAMNWYNTTGTGSVTAAGNRATDPDSMTGTAVMYDAVAGKIVTFGGSPNYQDSYATKAAHLITIGAPGTTPTVATIPSMNYARAFANSVVLPDGTVFITGGQSYAVPFSDDTATLISELWNPATQTYQLLPPHIVPRVYHSIALLLPDGRVLGAGGGMCGACSTNHEDGQIYSPGYLYTANGSLAPRPTISSLSATVANPGATLTITATPNSGTTISYFSLIRYGSTTHTVNTDQRRVALTPTGVSGSAYTVVLPGDAGVLLPGYWMVFAMGSDGVPSVASTIQVVV